MEESQIIQLAQEGNPIYKELLFVNNYDMVFSYLIKLTLDRPLAEDLCQETMVKGLMNLHKFKGESKFSTWLITIATNLFRNHYKKNKNRQEKEHLINIDLDFFSHDFDHNLFTRDLLREVLAYLRTLKPNQSLPFILKHYHGYDMKTIAKIMKCPLGTVKSRIHQTIGKVKEQFKEVEYEL